MSDPLGPAPVLGAASERTAPDAPAPPEQVLDGERLLPRILEQLQRHSGLDFSAEAPERLLRHIEGRQRRIASASLQDYLERLRASHSEAEQLADALSRRVTDLLGGPDFVALLEQRALPQALARGEGADASLRLWYADCGTGEEAYTLAILVLEQLERRDPRPTLELFASERHAASLASARRGLYPEEAMGRVSQKRLTRFFLPESGGYQATLALRNAIVFAHHDLLVDPPFARQDLIVCRHRLRDLRAEIQPQVLALFHHALAPGGWLLLHPSDPCPRGDLFIAERACPGLLRKRPGTWAAPRLPLAPIAPPGRAEPRRRPSPPDAHAVLHGRVRDAGLPSVLIDPDGRVLHGTAGAGRYLRVPGGEHTTDLLDLLPEPLRQALPGVLAQALEQGEPRVSAPVALKLEGRAVRVALEVVPVTDPAYPRHALVAFLALPEVTRPEISLDQAPPEELRALLGTTRAELDAVLRDAEQSRTALLGANRELASLNEELRAALEQAWATKEELQSANAELRMRNEDNLARLQGATQVFADWQSLLASTEIATLFLDPELRILRFTPLALERFNIRLSDTGRPVSDLASPIGYTELAADARRVLEQGERWEREIQAPDGVWYLARLLPYRSDGEEPGGVVVTLIDINARKQAEEALREADRRKNEFMAMLGHELRNPLAAMTSALAALTMLGGPPQTRRVTDILERQAAQLTRLVDDLLDVSRITRGKIGLRREHLDLTAAVRATAEAQLGWIRERGRRLRLELPEEPLMAEADPVRLSQILVNLLSNAVKFTGEGGRISLGLQRRDGQALISVRDDGIGMEPDLAARVFDLFVQGQPSGMDGSSGLGIGLSLVRALAELHGGGVEARSAGLGQGSELRVWLPLAGGAGWPGVEARDSARLQHGQRLLVVDDNQDAAESLRLLLNLLGVEVEVAYDAHTALRLFEHWRPSVVLADLGMPGMDGYALARRLRADFPDRPVRLIAVSGWTQPEHREASREAGFDSHLGKPVTVEELRGVLRA